MNTLKAENDAFRTGVEAEMAQEYEGRRQQLLVSSVQTLEALDRAIDAARRSDTPEAFVSGVMLVRTQLFRILQEEGLERVSVLGQPFDDKASEAVERRPVTDPDQDGIVVEELQGGHQVGGHVVRRAKVAVGEYRASPAPAVVVTPDEPSASAAASDAGPVVSTPEEAADPDAVPEDTTPLFFRPVIPPLMPPPPVVPPPAPPAMPTAALAAPARAQWTDVDVERNPRETQAFRREVVSAPPPELPPTPSSAPAVAASPTPPPPVRPATPGSRTHPGVRTNPGLRTNPGVNAAPPSASRAPIFYAALATAIVLLSAALVFEVRVLRRRASTSPPATIEVMPPPEAAAAPPTTMAIPEEITIVAPAVEEATSPSAAFASIAAPRPAAAVAGAGAAAAAPVKAVAATAANAPRTSTGPSSRGAGSRPATPPAAPVNPLPVLLAQAEQAATAHRFDDAIARYNDVLKLDPANADASAGKLHAVGERASVGRYFLTAVTMSEGKASSGGIKGFDGGQVVKSQCECALMYEINPPNPAQGQPYAVTIFLRNDSRKDIKPQSVSATINVNGSAATRALTLAVKQVQKGQRAMVARLDDTWRVGTTSWSMEAALSAGGNTYRAQLTWELRVPAAR